MATHKKVDHNSEHTRPRVSALVSNELTESAQGFIQFVREYAVVALAVGFIIAQQANTVIKQLVASFVDPWVQVLFGQDLSTRTALVHHGSDPIKVPWGLFVYDLIEFFFVLIFLYAFIKVFHLSNQKNKTKKKKK